MKPLLSILLISLLSTSLLSNETKKEIQMTDEEFLKQFMQLDQEVEEAKIKTKAMKEKTKELEKLEKTVDELAQTLGIDK